MESRYWLDTEKGLAAHHRALAAYMTLAQEAGEHELAAELEGACWRLGAAITTAAILSQRARMAGPA